MENSAALTVSIALAVGMIAEALSRHLRLPGIVLLLAAGVVLGPDVLGFVQPESLGTALPLLVGFAVAVILFEGGMNMNLRRLRRQASLIRQLLTVGAVITAIGGTLAAWKILGWDLRVAALFGTLMIVTGPTVITPLLRRIKVHNRVETILEAEGVLIDPIGAIIAVLALEVVLGLSQGPHGESPAQAVTFLLGRLAVGTIAGLAGGFLIALLLRVKNVVPEGLENVFTLSQVLLLFQLSNGLLAESGILTVTVAGMVVGNVRTRVQRDLMEFKEQLTVLFIGMLFVLLAANVRVDDVRALGWPGVFTVLALMFVVRPINILVCTFRSELTWRERAFLSWLAPRGIVAAAVASLFAQKLGSTGMAGGQQLQALVFMVIAMTVLIQGLSGGFVARLLGLRRPTNLGYAIVGANELGHALGRILRDSGAEVIFLDANPSACHVVEQDGFRVVFGNVLEERTLLRAQIEDRAACIAVTTNADANLLFAKKAFEEYKVPRIFVGVARNSSGVNVTVVREVGANVLFAVPRDLELWALRLRRSTAKVEIWRYRESPNKDDDPKAPGPFEMPENLALPLVVWRGERVWPVHGATGVREGDVVHVAVFSERREDAAAWLVDNGWESMLVEAELEDDPAPSPA